MTGLTEWSVRSTKEMAAYLLEASSDIVLCFRAFSRGTVEEYGVSSLPARDAILCISCNRTTKGQRFARLWFTPSIFLHKPQRLAMDTWQKSELCLFLVYHGIDNRIFVIE